MTYCDKAARRIEKSAATLKNSELQHFFYSSFSCFGKHLSMFRLTYFFRFFVIAFLNNIMRSFLHFHIGLRQILSHDSHTEQLNSTNKRNDTYQGWPSTDRISKNKFSYNNKDNRHKRNKRHQYSKVGRDHQRYIGKLTIPSRE